MADAQLQQFLKKIEQLNAFVALTEAQPDLRQALGDCSNHHDVVQLAAQFGFDIGRRWGDSPMKPEGPSGQPNLLRGECPASGQERTEVLASGQHWRLERIHSCQAISPAQGWYDQAESEWVLLLSGSATLEFEDEDHPRDLCVGDALLIAPNRRHRVTATDPDPGTVWLALFWSADA